jgi:hypothetical protein
MLHWTFFIFGEINGVIFFVINCYNILEKYTYGFFKNNYLNTYSKSRVMIKQ